MAKNYVEDGHTMDWTNTTDQAVASGDLVVQGVLCGVAASDIPAGGQGVLLTSGVFTLPKAAVDVTAGAALYMSADGALTTEASAGSSDDGTATDNLRVGTAWADAAAADASVAMRLVY